MISSDNNFFLASVDTEHLSAFLTERKIPLFRLKQIRHWIYEKFTTDPATMLNLPKNLQVALAENFYCSSTTIAQRVTAPEGTMKVLLALHDGNTVEAVMIPAPERMTFCISSQVGCPVQCRFCASGAHGLVRNLTAGEIIDQFLTLCRIHGSLPTNLVFMGIGEPLLNFENVARALDILTDAEFLHFSPRRITVSTSGITRGIYQLAELDKPLYLALSLHATSDAVRAQIIPDHFREPIVDILKACDAFAKTRNRLITLEYTLIDGVNDAPEAAKKLAQIAIRLNAKVNLIPYNPVDSSPFRRPPSEVIEQFMQIIEMKGANVTQRMSKGASLSAACGQLRSQHLQNRKDV